MDTFFISYDEPLKEENWLQIQKRVPQAQRVDGIKGFNRAHKTCAALATTSRFFTIDGDNQLLERLTDLSIPESLLESHYVLSWSARNSINGLAYGNGGIKNWPRHLMENIKSHEDSEDENSAIDFCFMLNYFQMPHTPSISYIHGSAEQAFRAGFREGVKMALDRSEKIIAEPQVLRRTFLQRIAAVNLERLRIWCSVGADVENGLWAIYGARLGCLEVYGNNLPLTVIRDYDWFKDYWKSEIVDRVRTSTDLYEIVQKTGDSLNQLLDLQIMLLDKPASRFFKSMYVNPLRQGPMIPC